MCQFAYDFNAGIPLNLLIIYGKDPNFKKLRIDSGNCNFLNAMKILSWIVCLYMYVYTGF